MMSLRFLLPALLLTCASAATAAKTDAVIFGRIELIGPAVMPLHYRLTLREVDTGELVRVALVQHERGNGIYDFGQKIQPGKYHMQRLVSPQVNVDFPIADAASYFQVLPENTVYVGTWRLSLDMRTSNYQVDYDMKEISLFAQANPGRDAGKFSIGVLGKPAVPLKTE